MGELERDGRGVLLAHAKGAVDGAMGVTTGGFPHAPGPHLSARGKERWVQRGRGRSLHVGPREGEGATPFTHQQPTSRAGPRQRDDEFESRRAC